MAENNDIKELIDEIICISNIIEPVYIDYYPGSEIGDGFVSKTVAVDVKNGNKSLNLFLKYSLNIESTDRMPWHKLYANEVYFYDVVYPAYRNFLKKRSVKDAFNNVPKCYGTSAKNIVALENLRTRNFVLFDKTQPMNDTHLILVLKTFAKFHAVSFSVKHQEPQIYQELIKNTYDTFSRHSITFGYDKMLKLAVKDFLSKMDPVRDKHILEVCNSIADKLIETVASVEQRLDKYSILTQGDCWVNNMMFLYEDNDKEVPKDMMLVDWQVVRQASPVYDIAYFFYTIATKEALSKWRTYLNIYYQELSERIKELGSNPDKLYPQEIFEEEWKRYSNYGFAMAFIILKVMLYSKEETPNFEKLGTETILENPELMFPTMKNDEEYMNRLRILAEHFIENDLI